MRKQFVRPLAGAPVALAATLSTVQRWGLVVLAAVTIVLSARPVEAQTWARTYGGAGGDVANSIVGTSDGGFAVAGYSSSFGATTVDMWIVRVNSAGGVQWQWEYGNNQTDVANSVVQTADGGFAVVGYTYLPNGNADFWVLKLNSAGGVQWQWAYGGGGGEIAYSIVQTTDGGFAVAGYTNSFGVGGNGFWILRLDSAGGIQWQKAYGGTGNDVANSIVQTSDGGFVVAGYSDSFPGPDHNAWILKLDGAGGIQWQKSYGDTGDDVAFSIARTSDGGFVVAGYTTSSSAGGQDVWVLRLDSLGEPVWATSYGGSSNEYATSVSTTTDGGCIVAGPRDPGDALILKIDSTGGAQWVKSYGGAAYDTANSVVQTINGGFAVAGWTNSFGDANGDYWVLRLNSSGDIGGTCSLLSPGGGTHVTETSATVQTQCEE